MGFVNIWELTSEWLEELERNAFSIWITNSFLLLEIIDEVYSFKGTINMRLTLLQVRTHIISRNSH